MPVVRRFLAPLLAFLVAACAGLPTSGSSVAAARADSPPRGVVSAADPRAAEAGAEMLRKGGSATDAAIATMLALTVVEPQSSGIGGGGFLVRSDIHGSVETIDGRETAPAIADPSWFTRDREVLSYPEVVRTGLSVGVPGNVALAVRAHERHGKLAWAELFGPAIRLARDGFSVSPRLHEYLSRHVDRAGRDTAGIALYYSDGAARVAGSVVRNPALAATLTELAEKGSTAFYSGDFAARLADEVASQTPGPGMTAGDLASYRAKDRRPVCATYRVYRICGMGPPSSGATTVIAILKQLERFDLAGMGSTSPVAWHLFAESQRLAYADRELYLADADFVPVPVDGLIAADYLAARGALISPVETMREVAPGRPAGAGSPAGDGSEAEEGGTSHFVTVDAEGNVVSYTSTIEGPFGSGIVFNGFYLNNELTDFSFTAEQAGMPVANRVEGGKRPRSSMAPTIVFGPDGHVVLVLGAAGGTTIPVQVARSIIGVVDWGLTAEQALALPVLFAPGDTVYVEQGSALEAMIPALRELGHARIEARQLPLKANAVQWRDGKWSGAADPRSEGAAVGE